MSTDRSSLLTDLLPLPLRLHVHPRARRLKLRLDPRRDELVLTLPPRANRQRALAWAEGQRAWVEAQLAQRPAATAIAPGSLVPIDGIEQPVRWDPAQPRRVEFADDGVYCGGPLDGLERRILGALRQRARTRLSDLTAQLAAQAGVAVRAVSVGDAGTRWGSCSASGAIRYNWRLVMAPPAVQRYVVAHEVAHRVHMNHGAAFHALEATLFGSDPAAARALLRGWSARLKRIGGGTTD